jgi:hypothetical protein
MCMFCRSLFVLLYFFFWPLLCCLCFIDLRILITPLVSSNSSSYISVCREVFATICTYCLSFKGKCETLLLAFIVSVCMFVFNRCMQRLFCLFKNSFPSYVIFFIHNSFQLKVNLAISYLIRHSIPVDDLLQSTEVHIVANTSLHTLIFKCSNLALILP